MLGLQVWQIMSQGSWYACCSAQGFQSFNINHNTLLLVFNYKPSKTGAVRTVTIPDQSTGCLKYAAVIWFETYHFSCLSLMSHMHDCTIDMKCTVTTRS